MMRHGALTKFKNSRMVTLSFRQQDKHSPDLEKNYNEAE
jgi:hypothetical protein